MKIIVVFLLLALSGCVKYSLTDMCACNEFEEDHCTASFYCSWNGSSCVDLECKYKSKQFCNSLFTQFRCIWNESSNVCEDHTYQCSELTKETCFLFYLGMNCMWKDDKCQPQDCTSDETCNFLECSLQQGKCGPKIDNLDCSSRSIEMCQGSDGNGNACFLNDEQECEENNYLQSSCSAYEDRITLCSALCYYDASSQSCISKECNQITEESSCYYMMFDIPSLKAIPCKWSNGSCNEVEAEEIETYNILDCTKYGMLHFTWQTSDSTCKQCTSFVSNPQFAYYEELMYGIEFLKMALLLLALLI